MTVGVWFGNYDDCTSTQHVTESSLDDDPWQLHVGSNSVTTLVVSAEETVWCGAGKTVMVVSTE